jgi:addiction module HigA family antidote
MNKKKAVLLLPLVTPGEILLEEFLKPLEISVYRLAKDVNIPRTRLNEIVLGRRAITPDTAVRLSRYFGTTPQFWINLQTNFELKKLEREGTIPEIPRCPLVAA